MATALDETLSVKQPRQIDEPLQGHSTSPSSENRLIVLFLLASPGGRAVGREGSKAAC
jgi:hypothetical protein